MLAAYKPYEIERSERPVLGVDASSRQITLDTCVYCSGGGGGVLHLLGAVSHPAPHLHLPTVLSVRFCSLAVLDPATCARTFSIYLCPLSILIDSSTGSPIHVLMLSIQAVRGLPRLRAPGIVPCVHAHLHLLEPRRHASARRRQQGSPGRHLPQQGSTGGAVLLVGYTLLRERRHQPDPLQHHVAQVPSRLQDDAVPLPLLPRWSPTRSIWTPCPCALKRYATGRCRGRDAEPPGRPSLSASRRPARQQRERHSVVLKARRNLSDMML